MLYATKEKFDGQRASIGRDVVVGTEKGIRWGKIMAISETRGVCIFVPPVGNLAEVEGGYFGYQFKECKTEADVEALKDLEWTWPVRV